MDFLKIFGSKEKPELMELPSGSFTVDPNGQVVSSTLPHGFPEAHLRHITELVRQSFQEAHDAHLPITEITVDYSTLKLNARELRGGVMIFLQPHGPVRA